MQTLVSIVIANRNGTKFISTCLDSVFNEKGNYEVILVDDASSDESKNILNIYKNPNLKVFYFDQNKGAAFARNFGVNKSRGKYLLFLDIDTEIKEGWYKQLLIFFDKYPDAGAAQVKLLKIDSNKYDSAGEFMGPFGFLIERARMAKDSGQFDQITPIFSGKTAGMIVRRDVFMQIKGFDEDYIIFLEDTDLCWRIWLSGFKVYFFPNIIVKHAFWTKQKPFQYYIDNRVYYFGCRNTLMTLFKNYSLVKLINILPINLSCWMIICLSFLLTGKYQHFKDISSAIIWFLQHPKLLLSKKHKTQKLRQVSDQEIFSIVSDHKQIYYYIGKAYSYVTGKAY